MRCNPFPNSAGNGKDIQYQLNIREQETLHVHTDMRYPHLAQNNFGQVFIRGTRYKAAMLAAETFLYGWTEEELLRQHSDLSAEQVNAVLNWFHDNRTAVLHDLQRSLERATFLRSTQSISKTELMKRLVPD